MALVQKTTQFQDGVFFFLIFKKLENLNAFFFYLFILLFYLFMTFKEIFFRFFILLICRKINKKKDGSEKNN